MEMIGKSCVNIRIRERREALGMTQEELAFKLGYTSRDSISKIESGKRPLSQTKLLAVAQKLYTTPEYLMGYTDEPEINHAKTVDPQLADLVKELSKENYATLLAYAKFLKEQQNP